MARKKSTRASGPLVPDRTGSPNSAGMRTRSAPDPHNHPHTNSAEGLVSPEVEAHAPGRTTDGATNNP